MKNFKNLFNNRLKAIFGLVALLFVGLVSVGLVDNPDFIQNFLFGGGTAMAMAAPVFVFKANTKFDDFLTHKELTQKEVNEMDVDKQAELYNEFNAGLRKAMQEAIEEKASKEDINTMKEELRSVYDEQMLTLNKSLFDQGVLLKRIATTEKTVEAETFGASLIKGLKENIEKLKAMNINSTSEMTAKANSFNFVAKSPVMKAVGNMTIAGNVTGEVPAAQYVPGLNNIASRQVRLLDILTKGSISSNLVRWVYQANKEGAAGQTTEGTAKNQIDFDLLVGSEDVVKTTAYIKVSDEMIEDIDFMASEINNELMRELMKAIELGAYSGAGTTNTLHGVKTVATAFAPGTFATGSANEVDNANYVDVLGVAANQIAIAEQGTPNYILMHPSDVTSLKMAKVSSSDKRYIERLAMIAGSLSLDGIPIIPTTLVTAGTYLIGDFTKAFMLERSGVNIQVGLDSDDFTKNFRTVRAEWRGVVYVKNNDRTAFVTGTFATDMAAIETA